MSYGDATGCEAGHLQKRSALGQFRVLVCRVPPDGSAKEEAPALAPAVAVAVAVAEASEKRLMVLLPSARHAVPEDNAAP